jgi:CDP-glycerol glycerophosphotransferase
MAEFGLLRSRRDSPLLSVVIPVYNVERYIADCLESLLAQSYLSFEAILVDDGSTDRSVAIAERYAAEDPRLRFVHQANAGLGAARNRGVAAARGTYLTFLDPDDLLVPGAYETMMSTIARTGSDMVVGKLERYEAGRQNVTRLMKLNHSARREQITLSDMPLMLADVFAVNKVYRRRFWDEAGLTFPQGLRYEDQPTLTRAFVAARRFDVVPELVYLWRIRSDGSSITQRRHELSDLLDRIESKRMSTALVQQTGHAELRDVWFRDILPVDMWEYFRAVPGCDDEYWRTLRSATTRFWSDETVPFERTRTPVQQRLMGWLVENGRREDLERLLSFIDEHRGAFELQVDDDIVFAPVSRTEELAHATGAPRSIYAQRAHERRWTG